MRKILLSTVAFAALAGQALAADLPSMKGPAPAPVFAEYNWTGIYAGGEIGGAWANNSGSFVTGGGSWKNTLSTGAAGGLIGGQYQWNKLVIGVEGDIAWLFNGKTSSSLDRVGGTHTMNAVFTNPLMSIGGRLGYSFDKFLPYVTGGFAGTTIKQQAFNANGTLDNSSSATRSGYYIGGGLDYAFLPNYIAGLEYRYYDFGKVTQTPVSPAGVANARRRSTFSDNADTLMLRLTYKFDIVGAPAPVAAKY